MLTQALAGHGRVAASDRWGATVFRQVIDPEAFTAEVSQLNTACRANRPVPGDRACAALAETRVQGVQIPDEVWTRVSARAADLGVTMPAR